MEQKMRGQVSDHLANERTFLSWIRTSIAIIAFGFVIERFALFMKQMSFILGKTALGNSISVVPVSQGNSAIVGILLVAFGTLLSALGFLKFKKTEKQIEEGRYQTSTYLDFLVTIFVVIVGIFLVVYLIKSIS